MNASSIPGDPDPGHTAYVVVTNERMRMSLVLGKALLDRGWSYQFDMSAVSPANFNGNIYVGTVNTETLAAGAPMVSTASRSSRARRSSTTSCR